MRHKKEFVIQDPVFHITTYCVWDCDSELLARTIRRRFGRDVENVDDLLEGAHGVFVPLITDGGFPFGVIALSDPFTGSPEDYSTLAHECNHCTFHMLRKRGLRYSKRTEEAYTYYSSFLISALAEQMLKIETKLADVS